jgi:outer membrane usher protein
LTGFVPAVVAQGMRELASTASIVKLDELLLQIDINHQSLDETVLVLRDSDGQLYVSADDLRRWRLRVPVEAPLLKDGVGYYALNRFSPLALSLDEVNQKLSLEFSTFAFEATRLDVLQAKTNEPVTPSPGVFLNYDFNFEKTVTDSPLAGVVELGAFNWFDVGTISFLSQRSNTISGTVRLDATWTIDMPKQMRTLRLGDSINQPGAWGRALRFGGIQYGTNFATRPGFVTLPLQSVTGQAVLPSTVDVYVNHALTAQQQVPPGPFAIRDLPVVTGGGDVKVVVRDLLGREQVITQSFYTGPIYCARICRTIRRDRCGAE